MKVILLMVMLFVVIMLGGCKDTVKVSCPDCTMSSVGEVKEFECKKCSVEAEFSENFKILQRPERD